MSKSRAWSLPGKLATVAKVLGTAEQKDIAGTRLLNKFSKPRNPTKKDPRRRLHPADDPVDGGALWAYNLQDIITEAAISAAVPDLTPSELQIWTVDQQINARGVHIDREGVEACISIIEQAGAKYTAELQQITGGMVSSAGEVANIKSWLSLWGCTLPNLQADTVKEALDDVDVFHINPEARRVLEIRASLSASSFKKLYAIKQSLSSGDRLRDMFSYSGAERTARWAGRGPQPQNLPAKGPAVKQCPTCHEFYTAKYENCPSQGYCKPIIVCLNGLYGLVFVGRVWDGLGYR